MWQQQRDKDVLEQLGAKLNRRFEPKTDGQARYLKELEKNTVTLVQGPAGSGKTWIACGHAARLLKEGRVDRIILTRPIVPCGKGYGFRKGDMMEKILPSMRPLVDAMTRFFGELELNQLIQKKVIELLPLDDMRGCSLDRAYMILDEAQNAELQQLHMFLTRFEGDKARVVLTGDINPSQVDLRTNDMNPFEEVIRRFEAAENSRVGIVKLTEADIVRHPLIRWIEKRFEGPVPQLSQVCPGCNTENFFDDLNFDEFECCRCKKLFDVETGKQLD